VSAFAVKVSSDKQTLILKGEPFEPRFGAGANRSEVGVQLQRVTMLLVQGEYAATALAPESSAATVLPAVSEPALLPSVAAVGALPVPAQSLVPYPSPTRLSTGVAEYVRMQNLSGGRTRSQLIDTYA
jgi:hypothetical protein